MLQCLEEEFQCQLEEQERHYGHYLTAALQAERLRAARYTPRGGGGGGVHPGPVCCGTRPFWPAKQIDPSFNFEAK